MNTQIRTSKAMKLFPEVVSEIFKNFSTTVIIHKPQLFPWFLGQICAGWRNVFFSSTRYIEIDVSGMKQFPDSAAGFERTLDILNFCLKCSKECPLSFTFRMSTGYYAGEYAYVIDILNALISQSMRWLTAEFHSLPDVELQRLHCVKGRTPLLQSLVFRHREVWSDCSTIKPVDERFTGPFKQSPSLQRLQLSDMMTISEFHWSSIESFWLRSLTDAEAGKLVTALSQATSLKVLFIGRGDISRHPIDIDDAQSMVTLPSLKKLTIDGHNILGVLTAPGLEHLFFNFGKRKEQIMTISSFVDRSSCPLKRLSLWYSEPAATVDVLLHIPGLSSLLLRHNHDGIRGSIKFLDCDMPEGASLVVPRLKSLKMEITARLDTSLLMEISAMVTSRARNPGVDGLRELSLRTNSTKPRGDVTILKKQCKLHNVKLIVSRF